MSLDGLDSVSLDQLRFGTTLAVSLQDVDRLDVILRAKNSILLNGLNAIDNEPCKEFRVGVDDLAGHGGLSTVDEGFIAEAVDADCELIFDVPAGLAGGNLEASDDVGGVDLKFDEFVGSLEELCSQDDN